MPEDITFETIMNAFDSVLTQILTHQKEESAKFYQVLHDMSSEDCKVVLVAKVQADSAAALAVADTMRTLALEGARLISSTNPVVSDLPSFLA